LGFSSIENGEYPQSTLQTPKEISVRREHGADYGYDAYVLKPA
jgi:hypothetical protein